MKLTPSQTKFLRWTLRLAFLLPIAYWVYLGVTDDLGVQPIVTVNRQTGYVVLFYIVTNLWLGVFIRWKWLGPQGLRWIFSERRSFGIAAGLYVLLHFFCYLGREAFESKAYEQIFTKFYLTMGFAAFVIVFLLTATSNDISVRSLGIKQWKTLHRLIHVASVFILVHIFLIEKGNLPLMALMTFPLIPFQLFRLYRAVLRKNKKA
jgi:sulfoxide reductase heme-binding subunit YedZ